MRAESGPMKFGDDWPGIFMRGDDAAFNGMNLARAIEAIEKGEKPDVLCIMILRGLAETLSSCDVRTNTTPQVMIEFEKALAPSDP